MNHKTKTLIYDGEKVEIDIKISNLISKMWKLGINTTNCCQAHCAPNCSHKYKKISYNDGSSFYKKLPSKQCFKYVWIVFDQAKDIELFYNIVAKFDQKENSMYSKMHGQHYKAKKNENSNWIVGVIPRNMGETLSEKSEPATKASGLKEGEMIDFYEVVGCGKNKFNMMIELWFPVRHLKYVEAILDKRVKQ